MFFQKVLFSDFFLYFSYLFYMPNIPLKMILVGFICKTYLATLRVNVFTPLDQSFEDIHGSHFIIDSGFLLHKVIWDRNSSLNNILEKYLRYVREHNGLSATIIFDGYSENPDIAGTKSWERMRPTKQKSMY